MRKNNNALTLETQIAAGAGSRAYYTTDAIIWYSILRL